MDMKKPIVLRGRAAKMPEKTTINLAKKESNGFSIQGVLIGCAVIVLLACAVAKFAVIDQFARLSRAEADYEAVHSQYVEVESLVEEYPEVQVEYQKYNRTWMYVTDDDGNTYKLVDRMNILDIVEEKMMNAGTLSRVVIEDNKMNVVLTGASLSQVAPVIEDVRSLELVDSVTLNMAEAEQTSQEVVEYHITVVFKSDVQEK